MFLYKQRTNEAGIEITGYKGDDSGDTLVIPSEVDGKPVRSVRLVHFKEVLSRFTSVIVSEGVEELGAGCFCLCVNLRHVKLPSSLKHVGSRAFHGLDLDEPLDLSWIADVADDAISQSVADYIPLRHSWCDENPTMKERLFLKELELKEKEVAEQDSESLRQMDEGALRRRRVNEMMKPYEDFIASKPVCPSCGRSLTVILKSKKPITFAKLMCNGCKTRYAVRKVKGGVIGLVRVDELKSAKRKKPLKEVERESQSCPFCKRKLVRLSAAGVRPAIYGCHHCLKKFRLSVRNGRSWLDYDGSPLGAEDRNRLKRLASGTNMKRRSSGACCNVTYNYRGVRLWS